MFVVIVALLFVLILGSIAFTDVLDEGMGGFRASLTQAVRELRSSEFR